MVKKTKKWRNKNAHGKPSSPGSPQSDTSDHSGQSPKSLGSNSPVSSTKDTEKEETLFTFESVSNSPTTTTTTTTSPSSKLNVITSTPDDKETSKEEGGEEKGVNKVVEQSTSISTLLEKEQKEVEVDQGKMETTGSSNNKEEKVENKVNSNSKNEENQEKGFTNEPSLDQQMGKLVNDIVENVFEDKDKTNEDKNNVNNNMDKKENEFPKSEEESKANTFPPVVFQLGDEVETPYGLAEIIKICDPISAQDITTMGKKITNRYVLQSTCWIMDGNVHPTYYLVESQIKRLTIDYLQKVSPMTLIRRANIGRIRGNEYFVKKEYASARDEYLKAQWFLMSFTEDKTAKAEEINSFKAHKFSIVIPLFNNLATVYSKLKCYKDSIVASRNSVKLLEELSRQEAKISEKYQKGILSSLGEEKEGEFHVGGTEVIRLLKSSPINWDTPTIKKHQQKALFALGNSYHLNQEYENSNIYLKLCNDPKQHKIVENLIKKNSQKIQRTNNNYAKAMSKSLSSDDTSDNNKSRKHKLSLSPDKARCSLKKAKQTHDDIDKKPTRTDHIRDWCRKNKKLVYLGAAIASLGTAYTIVMMRKKKQ